MPDGKSKFHFVSGLIGAAVGWGVLQLASGSGIAERWPFLLQPLWKYFPPIGLIGALAGGLVAGVIAPRGLWRGSGDLAGVTVGLLVCSNVLPERPGWLAILLLAIAYGFVGFVPSAILARLKSR